jgi:exodeoxyribonuclease VII large subunit
VGHETDFTIADFVADVRAPTPSAAAERVIEAKADIYARIDDLARRVAAAARLRLTRVRARVAGATSHRVFTAERGRIRGQAQRVDDLARRAETGLRRQLERARDRLRRGRERTEAFRWDRQLAARRERMASGRDRLASLARAAMNARRAALGRGTAQLESLSPLSVLSRGYALVWDERGRLLRDAAEVGTGDVLAIRVHAGRLRAAVTAKEPA